MADYKKKILIADDDPDILDVIKITLGDQYDLIEARDGQEALDKAKQESPDLILLDHQMPKMTGRQVCAILRGDVLLSHTPILLVTGKGELEDKVKGIESGADDYIVKPFEPEELLARVKMVLRRTEMDMSANPLTRLPGNITIQRVIKERLVQGTSLAVCYADLDRFKPFNDRYGFEKGDEVIQETARILVESIQKCGSRGDFVGHIGGDDFIFLTTAEKIETVCQDVIAEFDKRIQRFFPLTDVKRRYFIGKDRAGVKGKIPILSISLCAVTNRERPLKHMAQIASISAELKEYAKRVRGSCYIIDRRKK